MRIDRVEAVNLLYQYPEGAGFQYAAGTCTARFTTLILVHTDTGEVGVGSVYSHPALVHVIVQGQLDPLLRGEDPTGVEALWDRMYGLTRWYGRKGAAMSALGGVDTALWDLRGKAKGKPVWELLGGDRDTCPAYASGLLWNEIDALADEAAGNIADGFRRMKMRLARRFRVRIRLQAAPLEIRRDLRQLLLDPPVLFVVDLDPVPLVELGVQYLT